jgi:hypothetical protein
VNYNPVVEAAVYATPPPMTAEGASDVRIVFHTWDDAQEVAVFDLIKPRFIPDGFGFVNITFFDQTLNMKYTIGDETFDKDVRTQLFTATYMNFETRQSIIFTQDYYDEVTNIPRYTEFIDVVAVYSVNSSQSSFDSVELTFRTDSEFDTYIVTWDIDKVAYSLVTDLDLPRIRMITYLTIFHDMPYDEDQSFIGGFIFSGNGRPFDFNGVPFDLNPTATQSPAAPTPVPRVSELEMPVGDVQFASWDDAGKDSVFPLFVPVVPERFGLNTIFYVENNRAVSYEAHYGNRSAGNLYYRQFLYSDMAFYPNYSAGAIDTIVLTEGLGGMEVTVIQSLVASGYMNCFSWYYGNFAYSITSELHGITLDEVLDIIRSVAKNMIVGDYAFSGLYTDNEWRRSWA